MKPISLKIAGLHSFREVQEIDFRTLCEGGVFGIFGPTGSGKSSILDAMTLALYGKVERASNNTQGILNHAEEKLSVSFAFELENANGARQYLVERTYKRQDELRVKSATSRLIEVNEESVVLADKTVDVNIRVQELLGLTIEDFTRAVVLPQGKFAEFLSLKGVDRRQMLQRIFNLEQYGDRLNQKLKGKLTRTRQQLSEIAAEQAGLGDASQEALDAAREEVKNCDILLRKRETELADAERLFEEQKQVWGWLQEKRKLEEKQKDLEHEKPRIASLEEKLKTSELAEKAKPYAEELVKAKENLNSCQRRTAMLSENLAKIRMEFEAASRNYAEIRNEKALEEPKLLAEREQLKQAAALQEKITSLFKEIETWKGKEEQIRKELMVQKQTAENERATLDKWMEAQKQLKADLESKTVSPEFREKIGRAFEQKLAIRHLEEALSEAAANLELKGQKTEKSRHDLELKETEMEDIQNRMNSLFIGLQGLYGQVCDLEVGFEKMFEIGSGQLAQMKEAAEKEKHIKLALELAKGLRPGEACPVCGSMEHINPAQMHVEHHDASMEGIEELERILSSSKDDHYTLAALKMQLEQVSASLIDALPEFEWKQDPSGKETEAPGGEALSSKSHEDFIGYAAQFKAELKALQQDVIQLRERCQKGIFVARNSKQELEQLRNIMKLAEADVLENMEKRDALKLKADEKKQAWVQNNPELSYEEIEGKQKEISILDKQCEEIKGRLEKSIGAIEAKEREIALLRERCGELEKQWIEITGSIRHKEEQTAETQKAVQAICGDENVEAKLAATEKKIVQLSSKENQSYIALQSLQAQYQQADSDTNAAKQSFAEAEIRLKEADSKWQGIQTETGFQGPDQVLAGILSREGQSSLRDEINQFWDKVKQLESDLGKLVKSLNGKSITEEEFNRAQLVASELREAVREADRAKGAAQKALESLEEKHGRFLELEKERTEAEKLSGQYQKLLAVFKGNSFVEFIAEEQLVQVARDASERLGLLTRQRYAIEVDSTGGFIMRDNANGGVRRPVSTLSGGETFLTSLALALALSAQIQLRGEYPLQFFFLDEGFGTLDADLLDTVVTALEKLHTNKLAVGVISHVQELRARLPKRLVVMPAEASGGGTVVRIETL